jgi:hypothetical protein
MDYCDVLDQLGMRGPFEFIAWRKTPLEEVGAWHELLRAPHLHPRLLMWVGAESALSRLELARLWVPPADKWGFTEASTEVRLECTEGGASTRMLRSWRYVW